MNGVQFLEAENLTFKKFDTDPDFTSFSMNMLNKLFDEYDDIDEVHYYLMLAVYNKYIGKTNDYH